MFLIFGKMIGTSIEDHGHELIVLEEVSPFEDYEIEDHEDQGESVDEERKKAEQKTKRKFEGVFKWPQLIRRYSKILRKDPVEAFIQSTKIFEIWMLSELIDNHDNCSKVIEEISPDLIVIDAYYIPPCVVNSRVPWVRLYSANPLMLAQSKLPGGLKPPPMCGFSLYDKKTRLTIKDEQPERWEQILAKWKEAAEKIVDAISSSGQTFNDFLKANGCAPLAPGQQAHDSPHLNLYMFPKELDYDQDDDLLEYPTRWVRCDSLVRQLSEPGSRESKEFAEWREILDLRARGKQKVVFFSLGSLASGDHKLMARYVDYLRQDQSRLYVVSKGVNGDEYELPEGNMVGANYLPQTLVLEKADLAIIHGGNNSVTECLYYGKPMIVLPVFSDQLDNAQRIEDLKYGYRLDVHQCSQKQLLDTIDRILNDEEMIQRVASVGARMRSRDNLAMIMELLTELTTDGSLDEKSIRDYRSKSSD